MVFFKQSWGHIQQDQTGQQFLTSRKGDLKIYQLMHASIVGLICCPCLAFHYCRPWYIIMAMKLRSHFQPKVHMLHLHVPDAGWMAACLTSSMKAKKMAYTYHCWPGGSTLIPSQTLGHMNLNFVPSYWLGYGTHDQAEHNYSPRIHFSTGFPGFKIAQGQGRNRHIIRHHILGDWGNNSRQPGIFNAKIFHSERQLDYLQFLVACYGTVVYNSPSL